MRAAAAALLLVAACGGAAPRPAPATVPAPPDPAAALLASITEQSLLADVAWLTAPELRGRGLLSDDAVRTADRIATIFAEAGLSVVRQPIPLAPGQTNVLGVRRGSADVIIVSAHYDHLGVIGADTYWGADDNASGVAVLLGLARAVGRSTGGATVVFLASGAEEGGLLGAGAYVTAPLFPLERTRAVINFDMVGRDFLEVLGGRRGMVAAVGLESDPEFAELFLAAAKADQTDLVTVTARTLHFFGFDARTDDFYFRQKGVPAVHLSTGMHPDYHRPTDTADRLKPGQMLRVARLAGRALVRLADLK